MRRSEHTASSCNILRVVVETNCPRGGDSGHGGRTAIELWDEGGTDVLDVSTLASVGARGIRLELGGDTECATLIECLRFAADELERQWKANGGNR